MVVINPHRDLIFPSLSGCPQGEQIHDSLFPLCVGDGAEQLGRLSASRFVCCYIRGFLALPWLKQTIDLHGHFVLLADAVLPGVWNSSEDRPFTSTEFNGIPLASNHLAGKFVVGDREYTDAHQEPVCIGSRSADKFTQPTQILLSVFRRNPLPDFRKSAYGTSMDRGVDSS